MTWPDVWYGGSFSAQALRLALTPLSWVYALGWSGYRSLYDTGIKRSRQPHAPILCIGNLTVGGSGKTPLTLHIARILTDMGHQVVIGCSGYGGARSEGASVAPDGPLDPAEWSDEPALLRWLSPDLPLIVGRARVHAAEIVAEDFPGHILLMDDGFQHLPLRKDASILVDPPSSNVRCLPAGPYREPRSNLARADLVIGPAESNYQIHSRITGFTDLWSDETVPPPTEADALCAIGRPEPFFKALESGFGVQLRERRALPDHADLAGALAHVSDPVIVTAKDAVKLRMLPEVESRRVLVARHEVTVEPGDEFRLALSKLVVI